MTTLFQKFSFFLFILLLAQSSFAQTTECTNVGSTLQYQLYRQQGGPCCGRQSATLTYKGQILKSTQVISGMQGDNLRSDSNPHLLVTEGQRLDLNNTVLTPDLKVSRFAMNLTLLQDEGKPALPGSSLSTATVSFVCEEQSYRLPRP